MSDLSTKPYKGTRDFYPADMRLRNYIFGKWRSVCESYGYMEYDASVIEPMELFTAKTSEEIVSEQTFSFEDRGGRKVTLRPEMTPTVSRMVAARRQELGYPLRLYSIPNCFRYERMQRGRSREFWQLNADLFGVESTEADFEMIMLANDILRSFDATPDMYEVRINSRRVMNLQVQSAEPTGKPSDVIRVIDQKDKLEPDVFVQKLSEVCAKPELIVAYLESSVSTDPVVLDLVQRLQNSDVPVVYAPATARGFDYYTDIVFEVFDRDPDNNRSMFGGGRYDGLVGQFGVEPVATVGFGMGDVTLQNFLESHKLLPELPVGIDIHLLVAPGKEQYAQEKAQSLRSEGKRVSVDFSGRKLEKQYKHAIKNGIAEESIQKVD